MYGKLIFKFFHYATTTLTLRKRLLIVMIFA